MKSVIASAFVMLKTNPSRNHKRALEDFNFLTVSFLEIMVLNANKIKTTPISMSISLRRAEAGPEVIIVPKKSPMPMIIANVKTFPNKNEKASNNESFFLPNRKMVIANSPGDATIPMPSAKISMSKDTISIFKFIGINMIMFGQEIYDRMLMRNALIVQMEKLVYDELQKSGIRAAEDTYNEWKVSLALDSEVSWVPSFENLIDKYIIKRSVERMFKANEPVLKIDHREVFKIDKDYGESVKASYIADMKHSGVSEEGMERVIGEGSRKERFTKKIVF